MMAPTHVAIGATLALPVFAVDPVLGVVAASAAVVGSLVPDLDVVVGDHRKSLHFPLLGWLPAIPAAALAAVAPSPTTVAAAWFLVALAVHPWVDHLGGSDDVAPWEGRSERGVYLHAGQRWLRPRRWVRYDGAPEDVALMVLLAVPGVVVYDPPLSVVLKGAIAVGLVYGLVRKRVPGLLEPVSGR